MQNSEVNLQLLHLFSTVLLLIFSIAGWLMYRKTVEGRALSKLLFLSGSISAYFLFAGHFGADDAVQSALYILFSAIKFAYYALSALGIGCILGAITRFKLKENGFPFQAIFFECFCGAPVCYALHSAISVPSGSMMFIALTGALGGSRLTFLTVRQLGIPSWCAIKLW